MNLNILDTYIKKKPDRQNMLDLFAGEWSSTMPQDSGLIVQPGNALLFDDIRVKWAAEIFGGSLIKLLNSVGFSEIAIEFDAPTHQNGRSLAICAQKP